MIVAEIAATMIQVATELERKSAAGVIKYVPFSES